MRIISLLVLSFVIILSATATATATQPQGAVVTSQSLASQAGLTILQQGGNAIDAAVAVGYALAVTDPCCGNIGGGGFMLIHSSNGQDHFINFREKAPHKISSTLFLDAHGNMLPEIIQYNYLPVGVPGTVMGLNTALKEYGTLPLATVMQPAIQLAKQGFILSSYSAKLIQQQLPYPKIQSNVANIFFKNGSALLSGDRLTQTQLANTLQQIATGGSDAFYQGNIAKQIVQASQNDHGVFTLDDYKNYTVEQPQPVICNYRGYQIISAPPPSSGGITLCEMLKIIQHYPLSRWGYHSVATTHLNIEAMRYAYIDRNRYLGDPDYIKNPIQFLLSDNHINQIVHQIEKNPVGNAQQSAPEMTQQMEKPQTTHYSVIDKYGNAVAVTYTLNGDFGAKVIAGNTGFFLNNELDDFAIKLGSANQFGLVQGAANLIAPNKRPLSSMTPTIVTKNGKLFLILGSPGGSTITTTVLQIIENVIDFNMPLTSAVAAPRYHMQGFPNQVFIEANTFSPNVLLQLQKMGYTFKTGSPFGSPQWGAVAAIERDPLTGKATGAIDPRRPDGMVAYTK